MSAAFLARGARALLAAPYAVHVDATGRLFERVFKAMVAGESAPAALQRAQCAFVQKKALAKYKHPYYWALSLIGGFSAEAGTAEVS
jgi:CHAT domain-containing protein